ncbi:TPA: flagellar basal body P-ring formation chaperone FlgA [Citrobacter freundii]
MEILKGKRKVSFLPGAEIILAGMFAMPAPVIAAPQPIQHSARDQINARVIGAAGRQIEALAQKEGWNDYRYTFNVYIPSSIATARPCSTGPRVALASAQEMVISRMNFNVKCADTQGWSVSVAVRPDVFVPVVMPRGIIDRNSVLTADDLQMKKYNISAQRSDLMMNIDDAVGLTSKRTLQPGKPLTRAELLAPLLVKRNQPVMIVSHEGNITASADGVALKDGRKGDIIKIRNSSSQRIISGRVEDAGVVDTINAAE